MTTIVYTEEVMSSTTGNPPGNPANVTRFLVELGTTASMGDAQSGATRSSSNNTPPIRGHQGHHRAGSPNPSTSRGRFSVKNVRSRMLGYPTSYNPHAFTITAYLPNDGGKRLKVLIA